MSKYKASLWKSKYEIIRYQIDNPSCFHLCSSKNKSHFLSNFVIVAKIWYCSDTYENSRGILCVSEWSRDLQEVVKVILLQERFDASDLLSIVCQILGFHRNIVISGC